MECRSQLGAAHYSVMFNAMKDGLPRELADRPHGVLRLAEAKQ